MNDLSTHPADALQTPSHVDVGRCGGKRHRLRAIGVILLLALASLPGLASAQVPDQPSSRIPMKGKGTTGPSRQAFSGRVQSVDLKRNLLKVDTVEGGVTEIFLVKKKTPVSMADGTKMEIQTLAPGTNVIVYFEQKEDRRPVSRILVLAASEGEKKKSPPPS